jgi:hypothetical protein
MPSLHNYSQDTILPSAGSTADRTHYKVTLSTCRTRGIGEYAGNAMDVSASPTGVGLVRVIYPDDDEVFRRSKPTFKVVPPPDRKAD